MIWIVNNHHSANISPQRVCFIENQSQNFTHKNQNVSLKKISIIQIKWSLLTHQFNQGYTKCEAVRQTCKPWEPCEASTKTCRPKHAICPRGTQWIISVNYLFRKPLIHYDFLKGISPRTFMIWEMY